jgi:hypothetical protein
LFSAQPSIDLTTGILTYTPAANANGSAIVTVTVKDNGGTANGGIDATTKMLTITVTAVNDAPSFTKGANQTTLEDAGAQTVTGWATFISAGPPDESGQALNFIGRTTTTGCSRPGWRLAPTVSSPTPRHRAEWLSNSDANSTTTVGLNAGVDPSPEQIHHHDHRSHRADYEGADQTALEDAAARRSSVGQRSDQCWPTDESSRWASTSEQQQRLLVSSRRLPEGGDIPQTCAIATARSRRLWRHRERRCRHECAANLTITVK